MIMSRIRVENRIAMQNLCFENFFDLLIFIHCFYVVSFQYVILYSISIENERVISFVSIQLVKFRAELICDAD